MNQNTFCKYCHRIPSQCGCTYPVKELTDEEIKLLETEIFVKDAIIKCYKEALEQIATGGIAGESNNYKDTVYVMRQIASDALAILRKAQDD